MSDDGTTASPDPGRQQPGEAVPQPPSSGAAFRLIEQGRAFENRGRLGEAEQSYRQASELLRPLVRRDPSCHMTPHLAAALSLLGGVYRQLGQPAQSEACHREAVALYRRLVEQEGRTQLA